MILTENLSLRLMAVIDRGIPNRECIALCADDVVNMGQHGLMIGYRKDKAVEGAFPINDNLFWFGDGHIQNGDWVYVYTGSGKPTKSRASDDSCDIFVVHWGRANTMFADSHVVPILFRIDAVDVAASPADVPQVLQVTKDESTTPALNAGEQEKP